MTKQEPRSSCAVSDILPVLGLHTLDSGLDLLRHEVLHALEEPDGDDSKDDEGDDAGPGEAISVRILPLASLISGGQDRGVGAGNVSRR